MGEQNVNALDEQQRKAFTKALLNEVVALETMLQEDRFETGVRRIGAEQEMFFVDDNLNAAPVVMQVLEKINDDRLTTELAQFNIEANLEPQVFGGHCLRRMESELQGLIDDVREASSNFGAQVLLVGILPMLRRADLDLEMMTPKQRYYELNRVMCRLRGGEFHVLIKGVDQLELTHDSVMLEACNTSFQIHFQVAPDEFAPFYNLAQAVSAPVLATAVNSPVLLGQRLWSETRIALFERSVDVRSTHQAGRGFRPRVHFGDKWVKDSVLELFREDISRHKIVLSIDLDEDARAVVAEGGTPKLMALRLHNGTVYRWNRPCYGISNGVPHLRIENRVLPAGPTVIDEVANSAFFFGLMASLIEEYPNISDVMAFDDAKRNFFAAARDGLDAQFTWINGHNHTASALILDHLLPLARQGLVASGIDKDDVTRYLDVIEDRTRSKQTGSQWALRSLNGMSAEAKPNLRFRKLTASMLDNQRAGLPVHQWNLAVLDQDKRDRNWRSSYQTVGQIMTTDLFTVQPNDIVDLAASVMEWSHVRHVPVEDEDGHLAGLISSRTLLRMVARGKTNEMTEVGSIMATDLVTVSPDMPTTEAVHMMREEQVSCLPVVDEAGKLIGMVTERDLIVVSSRLLQDFLTES